MPPIPRDYPDLFLAPVALQVDQRLDEFAAMERDALHERVVVETNKEARTRADRVSHVVETLTRLLDLHGWTARWDDRGVRLSHGEHALVLGVPRNLVRYVEELPERPEAG